MVIILHRVYDLKFKFKKLQKHLIIVIYLNISVNKYEKNQI